MGKKLISKEHEDLITQLKGDVQHAFQNVTGNDQFWCRTLVRAVFSYLEAHNFVIRSVTLRMLKPEESNFESIESNFESIARIALLADTAYQPTKTGKLEETGEPKIPSINMFALTLRTYAEAGGVSVADIEKFFGDNAFNQLQRAKKVRDRLTHPKQLADITVAPAEVLEVTNAFNWVVEFVSGIEALLAKEDQQTAPSGKS